MTVTSCFVSLERVPHLITRFFVFFRIFAVPGFTNFGGPSNTCLSCDATASHGIRKGDHFRRCALFIVCASIWKIILCSSCLSDPEFSPYSAANHLLVPIRTFSFLPGSSGLPDFHSISSFSWRSSCLSRHAMKWYFPSAVAPPPIMYCNDRIFIDSQAQIWDAPLETLTFYGVPHHMRESPIVCQRYNEIVPVISPAGLIGASPIDQIPMSNMFVPEAKRLIYDSAKLSRLDSLLQELKAGDHRVLIYSQMTKMLDLMEEYLIYRQYKYLRLDGSSKLEDRRDMVIDWQTR